VTKNESNFDTNNDLIIGIK